MIKINIDKNKLEEFIDSIETDFNRLGKEISLGKNKGKIKNIGFKKFKEYFCDDSLNINDNLKTKEVKILKLIYNKISSDNTQFFKKIRKFIIEKFTEKIKFCPYCGKVPLIYFEKGQDKENSYKRMFQFDHFFPKNYFHKGIINFYNLIPSCNACNHLKGDINPFDKIDDKGEIFHPYFGNLFLKDGKIEKGDKKNYNLNYNSKHGKFFKLGKKYLNSQDTFNIFNFIQDKRTKMKNELNNFKINIKDLSEKEKEYKVKKYKNYFFKNYYPENKQDILKFSNGKLKKDLIENLQI